MDTMITTTTVGEILLEEFLKPMGISIDRLAYEMNVSGNRIKSILYDQEKITSDMSFRLAEYFGVSDEYFLDLQSDIDARNMRR